MTQPKNKADEAKVSKMVETAKARATAGVGGPGSGGKGGTSRRPKRKIERIAKQPTPNTWYRAEMLQATTRENWRTKDPFILVEFRIEGGDVTAKVPHFVDDDPNGPQLQNLLAALLDRDLQVGDDADLEQHVGKKIWAHVVNGKKPGQMKIDQVRRPSADIDEEEETEDQGRPE